MKNIIHQITKHLNTSQDDPARMPGISSMTANRWKNGHSGPDQAVPLRPYEICRDFRREGQFIDEILKEAAR